MNCRVEVDQTESYLSATRSQPWCSNSVKGSMTAEGRRKRPTRLRQRLRRGRRSLVAPYRQRRRNVQHPSRKPEEIPKEKTNSGLRFAAVAERSEVDVVQFARREHETIYPLNGLFLDCTHSRG